MIHTPKNLNKSRLGDSRLVKEIEAAEILSVSVSWLRRARLQGMPPSYLKFGRSVRYEIGELKQFIEDRRVQRAARFSND